MGQHWVGERSTVAEGGDEAGREKGASLSPLSSHSPRCSPLRALSLLCPRSGPAEADHARPCARSTGGRKRKGPRLRPSGRWEGGARVHCSYGLRGRTDCTAVKSSRFSGVSHTRRSVVTNFSMSCGEEAEREGGDGRKGGREKK